MDDYEITSESGRKLKCKCNSIAEAAKWWVEHDEFDGGTIFHVKASYEGWGSKGEKVDAVEKVPELFPKEAEEREKEEGAKEEGAKEKRGKEKRGKEGSWTLPPKSAEQRYTYRLVNYENMKFGENSHHDEIRDVNAVIERWARDGWRVHTMYTRTVSGLLDSDKERYSILFEFDEKKFLPPV